MWDKNAEEGSGAIVFEIQKHAIEVRFVKAINNASNNWQLKQEREEGEG